MATQGCGYFFSFPFRSEAEESASLPLPTCRYSKR